jgi:hypothetical protein
MTEINAVEAATYNPAAWAGLPGIDTSGAHAHCAPFHLNGVQSVVPEPAGSLVPDAEAAAREAPVKPVPAEPVPARESALEPARDGEFSRSYLAKG